MTHPNVFTKEPEPIKRPTVEFFNLIALIFLVALLVAAMVNFEMSEAGESGPNTCEHCGQVIGGGAE